MNEAPVKAEFALACPYCGGRQFSEPLQVTGGETTPLGVTFQAGPNTDLGIVRIMNHGQEILRAQLCQQCGTVARWFVENPNRHWVPNWPNTRAGS